MSSVGAGIFQAIFKVHSNLLQSREKPETFFWSNVVSFSLIAFFIIVGLELYPNSLAGPILGRLVGSIIPCVWALFRIFREFGFHYDFSWLKSSLSFNTYTFIYQMQQWIINQFDRILMLFFLSLSSVGVYDFAIKCLIPVELLMNSLHSSFYPKVVGAVIAQPVKGSSPEINRYYHGLTASLCYLYAGVYWCCRGLSRHLFPRRNIMRRLNTFLIWRLFIASGRCGYYFSVPYGILKYSKPLPVIYLVVSGTQNYLDDPID